ncbi:MAG TPA: HIT domain-containing protein [Candidatus Binataceae bacterium]|nr:HIT domain-containing protein [Candidatus Binataceae bacterium]
MARYQARVKRRFDPEPAPEARLWAPWRSAYLARSRNAPQRCIFCLPRLSAVQLSRRLVLYAGQQALVMLNRYPYNNGHLMVAPRRHVGSPELLNREERIVMGDLIALTVERLRVVLRPAAFNVGANLGRAAGAGFADHMHWHVVPRWEGDNNFMPVIGSTRVLSQHLEESYSLLAPHFKAIETALS